MASDELIIRLDRSQAEQLLRLIDSGILEPSQEDVAILRRATVESILRHKRTVKEFDVFLCHNSVNKPQVKRVGERLRERGILPWLDEWELQPGIPWQRLLGNEIKTIRAAAIFVGEDGFGPWQDLELEAFIRQFVSRGCPVIPVLLRSCKTEPELPTFLDGMTYVRLAKKDPDPLQQMIWGITGEHPDLQQPNAGKLKDRTQRGVSRRV